jgi:hypothetical protein
VKAQNYKVRETTAPNTSGSLVCEQQKMFKKYSNIVMIFTYRIQNNRMEDMQTVL